MSLPEEVVRMRKSLGRGPSTGSVDEDKLARARRVLTAAVNRSDSRFSRRSGAVKIIHASPEASQLSGSQSLLSVVHRMRAKAECKRIDRTTLGHRGGFNQYVH